MAVGFTPKHIEEFPLNELTPEQFLVIAFETARQMGWNISAVSNTGLTAYTNNGMFWFNAKVEINACDGVAELKSSSTGNEMVDWGKNKKTIAKFTETFNEQKLLLTADDLQTKYAELAANVINPNPQPAADKSNVLNIFVPSKGYVITPVLMDINILIFLVMAITGVSIMAPDNESLLKWGANFRPYTLDGQPWRLLTNCFLHIGVIHLLMNMYALIFIGVLLEPYLGKTRFISAYLLTGIAASVTSLWWHDLTISAGASGAIFGLYGVFLALLTGNFIDKATRKPLLVSIGLFVIYNLAYGLNGGIDNSAHIGGLVSGLVMGYAFIPSLKKPDAATLKFATIAIMAVIILASSSWVYKNTSNDIGIYDAQMKEFAVTEKLALGVFNLPRDAPKDTLLYALNEKGIRLWYENKKLLDGIDKLKLPDVLKQRNGKLKQYCDLRIKCYEMMYKEISNGNRDFKDKLEDCNKQIEAIINDLTEKKEK